MTTASDFFLLNATKQCSELESVPPNHDNCQSWLWCFASALSRREAVNPAVDSGAGMWLVRSAAQHRWQSCSLKSVRCIRRTSPRQKRLAGCNHRVTNVACRSRPIVSLSQARSTFEYMRRWKHWC